MTSKADLRDELRRRYAPGMATGVPTSRRRPQLAALADTLNPADRATLSTILGALASADNSLDEALEDLAELLGVPNPDEDDAVEVEPERAFVLHAKSGRTVITAPIREIAASNGSFTYLTGRLVGADRPNRNGALWTSDDLELGSSTVAGGPLNWLHDDSKIIGCLLDGNFVGGREAAGDVGNHIVSSSAVWSFLYPRETQVIERAAEEGQLYYSMECISREVACVGDTGCGESFSYADYDAKRCCTHLRERSSTRRFVEPLFQGAAVIVPPIQPGWANASVDLHRQAAALADGNFPETGATADQARDVAAAILRWANR